MAGGLVHLSFGIKMMIDLLAHPPITSKFRLLIASVSLPLLAVLVIMAPVLPYCLCRARRICVYRLGSNYWPWLESVVLSVYFVLD
ncbi:unnamed protein product [Protopolystoma xenopodis]|uniref:Uncharacterized protein n=1 Tax=Protopolystoma xenopodis TaxID=117903 RepID=A0A448X7R9_9PLAT|nr:unnamed protein product [Protopolystoma xenopodis]